MPQIFQPWPIARCFGLTIALVLAGCVTAPPVAEHAVPETAVEQSAARAVVQREYALLMQMACLSEAAYFDPKEPQRNTPSPGCGQWDAGPGIRTIPHVIQLPDISGNLYDGSYTLIVDDVHKLQVIAIRGTNNSTDWLTDIQFVPVVDAILQVTVHHGFQLYARAVLDDLLVGGHIAELNPTYPTYITGHSLGGAVAVLLGLYFHVHYPHALAIKAVYTYGQPRVFDNNGATSWPAFADGVYHVENCYDPVPSVPISDSFLGSLISNPLSLRAQQGQYQHIGHEILLLGQGNYWVPGQNEIAHATVDEISATVRALRAKQLTDHGIEVYISRLRGLAGPSGEIGQPTNPIYQFSKTCAYHQPTS
ncbi:MAG TPA: lipase family protein [Stellaceae bacterium]|jgi:hypothetical protein|nr:lipase family protein [Stellaceae bacterium]